MLYEKLDFTCNILQTIVGIHDIDTGIHLQQLGIEFKIGSIHHIGNKRQLAEITCIHHIVVLRSQLHALLLGCQLYIGLLILHIGSLHPVVELFRLHVTSLLHLTSLHSSLLHTLVALEQRTKAILHTYAHIPYIEILVDGRKLKGDRPVKMIGCHKSHLGQELALGKFLLGLSTLCSKIGEFIALSVCQ